EQVTAIGYPEMHPGSFLMHFHFIRDIAQRLNIGSSHHTTAAAASAAAAAAARAAASRRHRRHKSSSQRLPVLQRLLKQIKCAVGYAGGIGHHKSDLRSAYRAFHPSNIALVVGSP